MAKVTSKLQVTVPKALADRYGIAPGDEIEWEAAGDAIRVVPAPRRARRRDEVAERVRLFEAALQRQRERERRQPWPKADGEERGWTRHDLYDERTRPR